MVTVSAHRDHSRLYCCLSINTFCLNYINKPNNVDRRVTDRRWSSDTDDVLNLCSEVLSFKRQY